MEERKSRLLELRKEMQKRGMDAWMAPTNDFHGSEYIGEHFKVRNYFTGFTGSVGTVLVTMDGAFLWVDGRYFVQASHQLDGSGVTLCKSGEPGVPTVEEFILEHLQKGQTLGLDGRVINAEEGKNLSALLKEKGIHLSTSEDIVDSVWKDRPPISKSEAFFLSGDDTGESRAHKLSRLRDRMKKQGADVHLLTSLDDIAWLYNMRGDDIHCSPVIQAYSMITQTESILFVQDGAISKEQTEILSDDGIQVKEYEEIFREVESLKGRVLLDPEKVNFELYRRIPKTAVLLEERNPTVLMKAVKNQREMEHIRHSHEKDGVAMTRFLYWLKHKALAEGASEMGAASRLEELRRAQEGYLGPSFETISAYGDNAAMCHYVATDQTDRRLEEKGFYLVDAGGQYMDGTTDITRTIAMGPLTEAEKFHYTLVLKGMIGLSKARFRKGYTGLELDYMARGPLWEHGLDFNHGTGHGVGFLLNVHEPPNFIHWRLPNPLRTVFEEGMLTSNEPGYYEEGSHGIRIENLLLCREEKGAEGAVPFLYFETVTLCPIDLEPVILSMLDSDEKDWLNRYHQKVYEVIGPKLPGEEGQWLYQVTRPVK